LVTSSKLKNMGCNTSISLGDYFEEEAKIIALKKAISEGIESGLLKNFDPKMHLKTLKAFKKENG
jgi:antitoxin ParD1/3/4